MANFQWNQRQKKIFKQAGVEAIYLFGSRAQEKEGLFSDYDYAVLVTEKGHAKGDDLYFKLYDIFSEISPRTLKNDVIDIIFLKDAGLELRFHVIRYGKVIYDDAPETRLDFEAQTMLLYCDYRPLLDAFDKTIIQSL